MYDKCYFCLDQLPKLKKESTASFFVNFGGAGVQKSRPTLLYKVLCNSWTVKNDRNGHCITQPGLPTQPSAARSHTTRMQVVPIARTPAPRRAVCCVWAVRTL